MDRLDAIAHKYFCPVGGCPSPGSAILTSTESRLRRAKVREARSPRRYPAPFFASSRSAATVTRCVDGEGTKASIPPALIADAT